MEKMEAVVIIVLTLLVSIVILQNTQAVETKLLFLTATMPKALLLIITLLVGFSFWIIVINLLGANPTIVQRQYEHDRIRKLYGFGMRGVRHTAKFSCLIQTIYW